MQETCFSRRELNELVFIDILDTTYCTGIEENLVLCTDSSIYYKNQVDSNGKFMAGKKKQKSDPATFLMY